MVAEGVGHCDSPGQSAKYCTYSIVNAAASKFIDFSGPGNRDQEFKCDGAARPKALP